MSIKAGAKVPVGQPAGWLKKNGRLSIPSIYQLFIKALPVAKMLKANVGGAFHP